MSMVEAGRGKGGGTRRLPWCLVRRLSLINRLTSYWRDLASQRETRRGEKRRTRQASKPQELPSCPSTALIKAMESNKNSGENEESRPPRVPSLPNDGASSGGGGGGRVPSVDAATTTNRLVHNPGRGGGGTTTNNTTTTTVTLTQQDNITDEIPVLRLTLQPRSHVTWDDDVVNNEGLGRKSSKRCCIWHKQREFGESSTESSDDDGDDGSTSSSSSGGGGSGSARPMARKKISKKKKQGKVGKPKVPDYQRFHA
jgi:protein phosphatase 1 regulatory subunit 11